MTNARTGRSRHSRLGISSFILSFFPAVLLVGIGLLATYLISKQPPEADEVGYAFGMFILVALMALSELVALGLGIAGAFQRHRKRLFGFLGVACSILVLAVINSQLGFVDLAKFIAAFFMESQQP